MKIFKTSTPGLFSLVLEDKQGYDSGSIFDSVSFIGTNVTVSYKGLLGPTIGCNSHENAIQLHNAITALSIPCTLKHCTFITPATDGTPADEIGEKAA